jgi:hypothetical protein
MEAIYLADERVASIADELEGVKYLYYWNSSTF